jgi:tetratricopeptide (TPR) repeat protein
MITEGGATMERNEALDRGINLARTGEYKEALKIFEEDLRFTENPTAMSYYALCLVDVERKYEQAISLCLMAVEREFYNPDIYLNLGRVYMMNGQKAVAIRAFRKGLRIDDTHPELMEEIQEMGVRRRPPLSFLSRRNVANKLLGMLVRGWQPNRVVA